MVPVSSPVFTSVKLSKKGKNLGRAGKIVGRDTDGNQIQVELDAIAATDTTPDIESETVWVACADAELLR